MNEPKPRGTDISPPTPGVDDTPYIHFAIDQLTRDEELLGHSRGGPNSGDVSPISDAGQEMLGDDVQSGPAFPSRARKSLLDPPVSPLDAEGTKFHASQWITLIPLDNFLVPANPPVDPFRYPLLNFVPGPLRLIPLVALIICTLLMIAALAFSSIWALRNDGLWRYDGTGTSRYFVFEFLPQILGSIILLWVMAIQNTVQRVLPFCYLAPERSRRHPGVWRTTPLFLTNYLVPSLSPFRHGEPLIGVCNVIFWLMPFTIPLQASLFQTRFSSHPDEGSWIWTTVDPVAWVLIILYVLLVIALLLVLIQFRTRRTGLKWDVVSLADMFVLLRKSSTLTPFETVEARPGFPEARPASIGYWETLNRPGEIYYGIGEHRGSGGTGVPGRSKRLIGQPRLFGSSANINIPDVDLESQLPADSPIHEAHPMNVTSPNVRYRWIPWFLQDTWVVAWLVIAAVLMIAFVVVSFVHQAVETGFLPLLPAPTTPLGFSSANFLYSFLPTLLGMLLFLLWQPIDNYFRALQPFACLTDPHGSTAEQSLLLHYSASLPIAVSVKAVLAGHYRVAWISFVGVIAIAIPILAGGIFTAQFVLASQDIREVATMPAYYALVAFLVLYAFSCLLIWPTRQRYLPHDVRTLGDVIGYVRQSPLLGDFAFRDPTSKIDLVTRLLSTGKGKGGRGGVRYGFGVFVGRDGGRYLGIERLIRSGVVAMWFASSGGKKRDWRGWWSWSRRSGQVRRRWFR